MKIIIDNREPDRIVRELKKLDVSIEVKQLPLGDYLLSDDVVIERKKGSDFANSLYDNRLFEQAHELIEQYSQVIYLLEDFNIDPENYKHIFGALSYLVIKRGISFIPSTGHQETAALLERFCSWVQEEHQDPILSRVSPRKMTLPEKQKYLLQGLEGVGDKTADQLLAELGSPNQVFNELANSEILYTRTGNPKGITGKLADIHGIGPKFVENNQSILTGQNSTDDEQNQ